MVICLERGADLHMAQLMPLPITVSCFSKIQIGFTFLVPAHLCVCACVFVNLDLTPYISQPYNKQLAIARRSQIMLVWIVVCH